MEISYNYIDSLAPNGDAIKNGKKLAKNMFQNRCISGDDTVIFGECTGSGKKPYICSVDFIDKNNPVGRCSCPSRQIPCKHALGLMYAYADGLSFAIEEIPEDILVKRGKIDKRNENKEKKIKEAKENSRETAKPKTKTQITAAVKKINIQLEGIALADKLLKNILQMGLASVDTATAKTMDDQVKQLGNYYIGGIQTSFIEIMLKLRVMAQQYHNSEQNDSDNYENSISDVLYLSSLLKKAKSYLTEKVAKEEMVTTLDTESEIEEQIGHVWKLEDLMFYKKYIENASLVQLSFYSYDDVSRKEYVDEGYYICLENGEIFKTIGYRPYKAVKYIKEDDSTYGILELPQLYIYPGGLNKRVRWDGYNLRELDSVAITKIYAMAKENYAEVIKSVKNQIKNALSDKNPLALLKISDVFIVTEKEKQYLQISDSTGTKQVLMDIGYITIKTTGLMKKFSKELLTRSALLVMFENDIESGLLAAKPLSIVTEHEIVRLIY